MSRPVLGEGYATLGAELRRVRQAAGKTTSQILDYSATHVSLAERGKAHISWDFVEAYIALGGDRDHLFELYRRAKGTDDERDHPGDDRSSSVLDAQSPLKELARCYEIERAEDTYYLTATGAVRFVTNIVYVRAVTQTARFYPFYSSYNNDERPGVLTVEAGLGCRLVRQEETAKGHVTGVLELDNAVSLGDSEPYTFSYSLHVESDVPCSPIIRNYVDKRMAHHALRIQFTEPASPSRVWWFRGPHHADDEIESNKDKIMKVTDDGFYFRDFDNLHQEYWGLAWDWDLSD